VAALSAEARQLPLAQRRALPACLGSEPQRALALTLALAAPESVWIRHTPKLLTILENNQHVVLASWASTSFRGGNCPRSRRNTSAKSISNGPLGGAEHRWMLTAAAPRNSRRRAAPGALVVMDPWVGAMRPASTNLPVMSRGLDQVEGVASLAVQFGGLRPRRVILSQHHPIRSSRFLRS
jgi:hypothetical protein